MSLSRHTLLSVIVLVSVNAKADGNECDKVANDPAAVAACHADNIPNTDYVYAGNGLDAFDCTGLTKYAYGRFGTDLARGTTGQANEGVPVAEPYQRGDIIIFDARVPGDHPKCKVDEPPAFCANPYDPLHLQASHAGIYEGENLSGSDTLKITITWYNISVCHDLFGSTLQTSSITSSIVRTTGRPYSRNQRTMRCSKHSLKILRLYEACVYSHTVSCQIIGTWYSSQEMMVIFQRPCNGSRPHTRDVGTASNRP